jgi:uncharacterized coiled-coil protein SlyX
VKQLQLDARCYAIDTWRRDEQNGYYGDEILADLKRHHDPLYGGFSSLIQSTFDQALDNFDNAAIDLLNIDGDHAYAVVKHDFESWLPKMSDRAVILLHHTNLHEGDGGVWRLWEEIKPRYPHFEFVHEHGLGVIAIGPNVPDGLLSLVSASELEAQTIRHFFEQLGERLKLRRDKADQQQVINNLSGEVAARDLALAERDATVMALTDELTARDARINAILTCQAWRWSQRVSRVKQGVKGAQLLTEGGQPKEVIGTHACAGCKSTLTVVGVQKGAHTELKHSCGACGDDSAFCCATKPGSGATKGMDKEKQ